MCSVDAHDFLGHTYDASRPTTFFEEHTFPTAHQDDRPIALEPEQQLSLQLRRSLRPQPLLAVSSEPLSFGTSNPVDALQEVDLSSSPAVMFLSSFSSAVAERLFAPDDEGALVAGYTLGPIVGRGGFSVIRTASSVQGGTVAVKIVRHSDFDKQPDPALARKSLDREAQVWASLNHEHILPLFTVQANPITTFFFTAYCPAGSLFDILKRDGRPALPQDDVGMMFRQVVRGLRYMHEVAGYVHGDMKLENVLVDDMGVCKISDFGMARKIGQVDDHVNVADCGHRIRTLSQARPSSSALGRSATGKLPTHLRLRQGHPARHRTSSPYPASGAATPLPNRGVAPGSLPYASPELLLSPHITSPYAAHPAQDIWALGVMLFTMFTGKLPFSDSFEPRLQLKILHGVFEMPQGIGRCAEQALRGCIERSVPNRWTIAMVDEVAWGIGWGSVADDVTPPPEPAMTSHSPSRTIPNVNNRQRHRSNSRSARSASPSTSRPPYEHTFHHPLLTPNDPTHLVPTQPSLSSLSDAILHNSSSTSDDSSADWAVIMTPSSPHSRARAQRPRMISLSRSRSPNETPPATPRDSSIDAIIRRKASPHRPTISTPASGLEEESTPELDPVEQCVQWPLSPDFDDHDTDASPSASHSRGRAFSRSLRKAMRNESTPPVLSPTRVSAWARASTVSKTVTVSSAATPIAIPGGGRSKSLGSDIGSRPYLGNARFLR